MKRSISTVLFLVFCIIFPITYVRQGSALMGPNNAATDSQLTIYTYESLLDDPGFDYIGAFANYSGISKDAINLVLMDDANSIVSQATLEKDSPVADVLIGLDNVLVHTAKEKDILQPYNSPALSNISNDLISNLDPDKYLLPYDYGIISLFYDSHWFNDTVVPNLDNLTLQDLADLDLDKKLIIEDPTLSSTGLGFLLWTIAVFGDPTINFDGILGQDWRSWWDTTKDDLRIAPSWGAAFSEWWDAPQNRSLMVSYGTSPAYSAVLYDDPSQSAWISHENNSSNAWLQIEGLGLVKNAPHESLAKDFIDWFLSTELQDHIATNNWMYPANIHAAIDPVFASSSINPDDVNILNNLLTPTIIAQNLDQWQTDWETVIAGNWNSISGFPVGWLIFGMIGVVSIIFLNRKYRN
ncbi:MAG: thiamine ABC transporter substrate-binding protein [Promethearchaeota archaeon]